MPTPGSRAVWDRGGSGRQHVVHRGGGKPDRAINPTTHVFEEFSIDASGQDKLEGITVGPDSNLWFTLNGLNKIGALSPKTGAMIARISVPTANAGLSQIVSNPTDGNLWFTEGAADKVAG